MNKQKFIELISSPERTSSKEYRTLEQIVREYPYFQGGHTVLAKAGQSLKAPNAKRRIATAATYATNRNIFKQYILSSLVSSTSKAQPIAEKKTEPATKQELERLIPKGDQSDLINEIYSNLENWRTSRELYLEYDKAHPEDIVIEEVTKEDQNIAVETNEVNQVDFLKSQVAAEVAAEEEETAKKTKDSLADKEAALEKLKAQVTEEALQEEKNKTLEAAESAIEEFTKLEKEKAKEEVTKPTVENKLDISDRKKESPQVEKKITSESSEETKENNTSEVYSFNKPTPVPEELPQDLISKKDEGETKAVIEADEVIEEETNSGLISSDELTEIVDKVSHEVEESDSKEDIIIEEISEDEISAFDSQISEIDGGSIGTEEEAKSIENEIEIKEDETKEDEISANAGLSNKISLDDVKKFDPDDVFDTKFEDEDIDFKGDSPLKDEVIDKKEVAEIEHKVSSTSTPIPLENPSLEELDELEISGSVDNSDISLEDKLTKEESEKALGKIDEERKTLKLVPGASKGAKKFRLSVMKRPHNFTKPKKEENSKRNTSQPEAKTIPAPVEAPTKQELEEKPQAVVEKKPVKKTTTVKKTAKKATETKPTVKKPAASKTKKAAPKKKTTTAKKATETEDVKKKASVVKKENSAQPEDHKSIIDSFIASEPSIKISKEKLDDLPIEDLSINYESFPDSLITENLANILFEQGKKEKSIKMIEKLIVKHPEKENYYKIKIDQIKKESE